MKFTKRIAYCGGVSALLFSLNSNAMGQNQEAQGQDGCKDNFECEADYSQCVPPVAKIEEWNNPYERGVKTTYVCSIETRRQETDITLLKGILKIHKQTNSRNNKHNRDTYTVEKIVACDEKSEMQQEVSQLVDLLNQEQFSNCQEPQTISMVSAEGEALEVEIVSFEDTTLEFTIRRVGTSTGPDFKKAYNGREALKVIRATLSEAEEIQTLNHVTGRLPDLSLSHCEGTVSKRKSKKSK